MRLDTEVDGPKKLNPDDVIAKIVITGPGLMDEEERKIVARWLRRKAADLIAEGDQYTDSKYTARLHGPLANYKNNKDF